MYQKRVRPSIGRYGNLLCGRQPFSRADLSGAEKSDGVSGRVEFFSTPAGIVISSEVFDLPYSHSGRICRQRYDMRIEGLDFESRCERLPSLFGNCGYAWGVTVTDAFSTEEIIGRSFSIYTEDRRKVAEGKIKRAYQRNLDFGEKMIYNV